MEITVKNLQSSIPLSIPRIQSIAKKVVGVLKRRGVLPYALTIVFVGTQRMRRINRDFLKHDYVTDVLTFDLEGCAEIVICPSVAAQNARAYTTSLEREVVLYLIHGLLHLAGFNDHDPRDIERMRLKEKQLLEKFYD